MNPEDFRQALKLLFENFWIVKQENLEEYNFLRRHQHDLQREVRQRFGMNILIRPQYIQLVKRPQALAPWMGENGFISPLDYTLFCCGMAFIEDFEAETPFMLDEMIRSLQLMIPEEVQIDWTNYTHRKSLVRAIQKMEELYLIKNIQGDTDAFAQTETNQEVLYFTTPQARAFLLRAPQSYAQYTDFSDFWEDQEANRSILEKNQQLYQRLLMEPMIQRTQDNEEIFIRMRNYYRYTEEYVDNNTDFHFELYRDYAAFTIEQRDTWHSFPSRLVVDEILIQLATLVRKEQLSSSPFGVISLTIPEWQILITQLQKDYQSYWSKEFSEMTLEQLSRALLDRGKDWQLVEVQDNKVMIQPVFSRLIAEMRTEDEQ